MPQIIFTTENMQLRGIIIGKRGAKIRELKEKYQCEIITNPQGFIITSEKEANILACNSEMMRIKDSLLSRSRYETDTYTYTKPKTNKYIVKTKPIIKESSAFELLESSSDDESDEIEESKMVHPSPIDKKAIENELRDSLFDFSSHIERHIVPARAAEAMGWKHQEYTEKQVSLFVKKWVILQDDIEEPMKQWVNHCVKELEAETDKELDDPESHKPIPEGVRWADLF
tara:strand:- start:894 stop:1580 length:687 start_codon:yes stop_codon:yes gene_type:complete